MADLQSLARRTLAVFVLSATAVLALLGGAGSAAAQTQTAVEYYYSVWNFYFVTSFPAEIAALDGGAFGGAWQRTGQTFDVWSGPTGGALPDCRFFSTGFSPKSSHFYTPFAAECEGLKAPGSGWQFEAIAFYVQLPDVNGNCPAGTTILYRLYNNGMGGAPNHRFTTSAATFNQMLAAGWIFEGDGRTGASACVPQQAGPPAGTAEGIWIGTTSNNTLINGIVLDDGTFYFLYSVPNTTSIAGVVQGNATAANGQFNSSNAKDFNITGFGVTNGALAGTYVPKASLAGVFTSAYGSGTFSASYQAIYDQPASLTAAAGTYSGQAASSAGIQNVVVTLNASGAFSGASTGCSFTGVATPRGSVNVFNLSVTFHGGACLFGTSTLFGIAYYDAPNRQLIAVAPNAARTDGFLGIGVKP